LFYVDFGSNHKLWLLTPAVMTTVAKNPRAITLCEYSIMLPPTVCGRFQVNKRICATFKGDGKRNIDVTLVIFKKIFEGRKIIHQ